MSGIRSLEMTRGRVFVLTIDTGERIREVIETFCSDNGIKNAKVTVLGGMLSGSSFVSGPLLVDGHETTPIQPAVVSTDAPTEFHGVGTVFPDEAGKPVLHLHGSIGRRGFSATGCFRENAIAWLTMEALVEELVGEGAVRRLIPEKNVAPLSLRRFGQRRLYESAHLFICKSA